MGRIKNLVLLTILTVTTGLSAQLAVKTVKRINIDHDLRFTGTVEAVNQGTASSQTSGRVVETLVDVGDLVKKEDIILRLRDTQQRANFDTAQAGVNAAQAQFDAAEKEHRRVEEIRAKKLVSQSVADQAKAARDGSKAALEAANGRLKDAREQLEYTRVRAPYSGIVLERHVEVGETVNPGSPLITGMSLERLRVIAEVPQKDIDAIRNYQASRVETPSGDDINVTGSDLTFFGYADPKTSTFKIRANLPAGTEGLYPGMYLPIYFKIDTRDALVVPLEALVYRGEVTAVYIQNGDRIDFRQVKAGLLSEDSEGNKLVEILSGVNENEAVYLSPASTIMRLKDQANTASEQ